MQRLVDFKMSRIGKLPVEIPSGVNVSLENDIVSVKGPKGELLQKISPLVKVNIEEKSVSDYLSRKFNYKRNYSNGLVPFLQSLERNGMIEILDLKRVKMKRSNGTECGNYLVWKVK